MHSTLGGNSEGRLHFHICCRSWKYSIGSSEEKGECYREVIRQAERNKHGCLARNSASCYWCCCCFSATSEVLSRGWVDRKREASIAENFNWLGISGTNWISYASPCYSSWARCYAGCNSEICAISDTFYIRTREIGPPKAAWESQGNGNWGESNWKDWWIAQIKAYENRIILCYHQIHFDLVLNPFNSRWA